MQPACVEEFHHAIEVMDFLDAQMLKVERGESCGATMASIFEVVADAVVDLRATGRLQRDIDAQTIQQWLHFKAKTLRELAASN